MRAWALEVLVSSRLKTPFWEPLESLYEQLGCDDAAHCAEILQGKNFLVKGDKCLIRKSELGMPDTVELADVRKVKLISAKMPEVPGHVCGAATTVSGLGSARKKPAAAARLVRSDAMAARAAEVEARKEREAAAALAAEEERKAAAEKARLKTQAEEQEKKRVALATEIKELLGRARTASGSCKFDEARRLLADARKRDARVAEAEGAAAVEADIEEKETSERERKAREEREEQQRKLKAEEEKREREERGVALLGAAKKALGSSVLARRLAEHEGAGAQAGGGGGGSGASSQLKSAIVSAKKQIEGAKAKVEDAQALLPGGHRELADAKRMIAAEEELVGKAEKSVKRRELEVECDGLMAQYRQRAAAAEKFLVEISAQEELLQRDRDVLVAKALDPAVLVLAYLDQVEEVASSLQKHWAACEELHVQLREHHKAASQVLAKVAAIPDASVAAKGKTAAITSFSGKLDAELNRQQAQLVATKEQYDAALLALVGERARRKAEEEQVKLAKIERYRKRKQRPLQPFNEDATHGWGVGVDSTDGGASENKRLKEATRQTAAPSAASLMDDTVRRIVEAWSARRLSGEQLHRASTALREVACRDLDKVPLLQTVGPVMGAQVPQRETESPNPQHETRIPKFEQLGHGQNCKPEP